MADAEVVVPAALKAAAGARGSMMSRFRAWLGACTLMSPRGGGGGGVGAHGNGAPCSSRGRYSGMHVTHACP